MKSNIKQSSDSRPSTRDPSGTIGRNIEPFLLLELLRGPSYGYDLIKRMADCGFRRAIADPGVVYKLLRSLEEGQSIRSRWLTRESGPARRYYEITNQGRALLRDRAYHLKRHLGRIQRLLDTYTSITGKDLEAEQPPERTRPEKLAAGDKHQRGR